MKRPIYLDYHATTPTDPRVVDAMLPYFTERFGNASSVTHAVGVDGEEAVEGARRQVADLIHASPEEIVFTSGATESNNLVLLGLETRPRQDTFGILTSPIEHPSVLDPCRERRSRGGRLSLLPVDPHGLVEPEAVRQALGPDTTLVSLMLANNEIGTLHPMAEIVRVTREAGALLHTDAAQAVGKIPVDVEKLGVDFLSFSGHKICGPKGVGVLYVRRRDGSPALSPLIHGGGQEGGLRAGTLNVPGIVGLGAACQLAALEMEDETRRVGRLRDRLAARIQEELDGVALNGHPARRLPNNLNLSFAGVGGEALLLALGDVAVSTGSACASSGGEGSHVLKALGRPDHPAQASLRFGLGRFTTQEEIDEAATLVVAAVRRLRELSPLGPGGTG
jgi:cysteine desulfurase